MSKRGSALALLCGVLAAPVAQAEMLALCPNPPPRNAARIERLLELTAAVRAELQQADTAWALISRTGLDLRVLDQGHSHSGLYLPDEGAVRQLYYDCRAQQPRVFDEGLPGFVQGVSDAVPARIRLVILQGSEAREWARRLSHREVALSLVGPRYSANAHAWSVTSQNCNQWVAEVLAAVMEVGGAERGDEKAWGASGAREASEASEAPKSARAAIASPRATAQQWLQRQGHEPAPIRLPWRGLFAAALLSPHLHLSDHPEADLQGGLQRVWMPDSLEALVRRLQPQARRVEFCLGRGGVVRREGWGVEADPLTRSENPSAPADACE